MFEYLQREIDTSKRYDTYFKKSNCKVEYLGYGTTDLTLELMKKRTYEYKNQTKKLAATITNGTLAKKTQEIQHFLYHYLQYKADGYEQNLKSPDCAYTDRLNGLDCKSYSVFGGSLLHNKGIHFYYRKVKQPNIKPKKYTHVYIVIPKNQKTKNLNDGYYVIDGTKRQQNEVHYTKKKDIQIMADKFPHYGLNGVETTRKASNFIQQFDRLLSNLQKRGVSESALLDLKNAVNYYLSKNQSAEIKPVKEQGGIYVGKTFVRISNFGLNGVEGEESEDDYTWIADVWNFIQGLDFKCWGSQAVKEEAMKGVINFMTTYIVRRINILKSTTTTTAQKEAALNQYVAIAYRMRGVAEKKRTRGYKSCSDGRIAKVTDAAQQFINKINNVKATLSRNYQVSQNVVATSTNIGQYGNGTVNAEFGGDNTNLSIPQFSLIGKTTPTTPTVPTTPTGGGGGKDVKEEKSNAIPITLGILGVLKVLSVI